MMKFKSLAFFSLLVFVLVFGFITSNLLANEINTDQIKPMTLRLGHTEAIDSIREKAAQVFAEKVKELSKGKITIKTFPAGQLGDIPALNELVQTGALDFACSTPAISEAYDPTKKLGVVQLPFLFDNYEQAWAFMDGEILNELWEPLQQVGIRYLSMWENGFRHITNSTRPIYTPKDLKGLKIRVVKSKVSEAILRSIGANPVPMAFTELYTALQSKVVDGQENPLAVIYAARFNEVQEYLSLTGHQYDPIAFIVSEKTWQKLNEPARMVIKQAADHARDFIRQAIVESEEKWLTELKAKGMKVNRANISLLREAAKGAYEELEPRYGKELIQRVVEKAEEIRKQYPEK